MKVSALQNCNPRRSNSFRAPAPLEATVDGVFKSPGAFFWLILHGLCCLISLVLGFRFSRLIFFLLFSTSSHNSPSSMLRGTTENLILPLQTTPSSTPLLLNRTASRVVVGRHGIRIRPWPHPNPTEVMRAHSLIERVQKEQRAQYGIKSPRPLIVVTPTYVRTFQTLHLTSLMHSLMLVPYDLTWIVVEASGASNETASVLSKSGLQSIHIAFDEPMPDSWEDRHRMEARMRLRALRIVREQRLDGIVVFADDSNMHSMELFDEIQSVKWIGAVSVGILAHSGHPDSSLVSMTSVKMEVEENLPVPVQGPSCNSSGQLVGWHTFNSLPYMEKSATYIDDGAMVLPRKLEWAGFVLNSRLVWKEEEDKPQWVRDLDSLAETGDALESPLSLLKDASFVEPLGKCGRKVLLWWLRVEARADSKFPPGWFIDPPLDVTVPAKRTPWPDAPPELRTIEKVMVTDAEKHPRKARSSRSRHGSRKRKHDSQVETQISGASAKHTEEN
ncbi:putative beta-1,4-xylosyltransferase IRX14H isoform X1 [Cinnamomum micranthum f. kanehirae]|uniref:Glycosyltransferases n=1 Tax=Cinnamomum micranthum f. kanehirae TaxID=337451 RepID=A0A3S3NDN3_9MAGN|nr:putative beta-1,4-xylosyltransferase IRX14H isoform X1 [Cinnamomum micranthum f. kanehirae]